MRHRLRPSLAALEAFEAGARLGSFRQAADELNVTQSAISRQIRGLEGMLGIRLFELVRQRVVLTELGRRYSVDVRRTIDGLEDSTRKVMALAGDAKIIELAILPTFACRWLIPHLPMFLKKNPGVLINLTTRLSPFDFVAEPFDAAIHFGAPAWPAAVLTHLFDELMAPVCSPKFMSCHGIRIDSDLATAPLLQQTTRPNAWADWFRAIGVATDICNRGARYDQFTMLCAAAISGLGAALLPEFMVQEELRSGELVMIGERYLESDQAYYLVIPEGRSGNHLVDEFRSWILASVDTNTGRYNSVTDI
jgi:LysR family glycine cleavage system transcriptional activator